MLFSSSNLLTIFSLSAFLQPAAFSGDLLAAIPVATPAAASGSAVSSA
jgi:hypothetical protein